MIDRIEILSSRIRRLVSRNRWSARILGVPPAVGHGHEPGLVLIQVDGLSESRVQRALSEGRMPFLKHLVEDEGFSLRPLYSGMPSSTPGFQAEFFYGIRTAVPAFGYRDAELGRQVSMNDPVTASVVETRLLRRGRGLLRGGSAWSNIFGGDAAEPHLCASTAGLDLLLQALNPLKLMALVLWNGWSVVRVALNLVGETGVAIWDFLRGALAGRDFMAELRFVPARVVVSAVMREIVTAGACIDAERGLSVIQLNLLGYDEHAHRRGPESRFASWTLHGLDRSIRRVWLAAHRSKLRDYQVWVYSDHGQEATVPYPRRYGRSVGHAVADVYQQFREEMAAAAELRRATLPRQSVASGTERSLWLRLDLPDWMHAQGPSAQGAPSGAEPVRRARAPEPPSGDTRRPAQLEVVAQGPVGFVYLPEASPTTERRHLARTIALQAHVPMTITTAGPGQAWVFLDDGTELMLPRDKALIFGPDHPHLDAVAADVVRVAAHEHAGDIVLMGWNRDEPLSLQLENGAHGGPGPGETSAFVLLSPESALHAPHDVVLRPGTLRLLAVRILGGLVGSDVRMPNGRPVGGLPPKPDGDGGTVRLMTYNVHGCRGMDGKFSPNRIARVIARARPDVVCLQELDQSRVRSGRVDQIAAIAASLQSDYEFHAVAEVDDGRFGNAVLSAHPMRLVASGPLPGLRSVPGLEDRGVLWVATEIDGEEIQILNTHLSILGQERRLQVDALVGPRWLGHADCRGPAVLCGDFNASAVSGTLRRIEEKLRNVDRGPHGDPRLHTWSSRIPMRRIDHLFTSPELRVRGAYVPRNRLTQVASDHLPLVVDLCCMKAATAPEPVPAAALSGSP
jgi:endonuclease/exonuclease/phosphatase family metal-dependent hydrolase